MATDLAIFSEQLPAAPWRWRSASINGGGARLPSEMATSHLFYTLRMVWNHSMPMQVGRNSKRYCFSASYTPAYMQEAVQRLGAELATRTDLAAWQRFELEQMARYLRGQRKPIGHTPKLESHRG